MFRDSFFNCPKERYIDDKFVFEVKTIVEIYMKLKIYFNRNRRNYFIRINQKFLNMVDDTGLEPVTPAL
jgi:hypothetical protein